MIIPLCACGCGEPTDIAKKTRRERDEVSGQPIRYKRGHKPAAPGPPLIDRFWSRVHKTETCWLWTGTITSRWNYPRFCVGMNGARAVYVLAHRWSYKQFVGPIPEGYTIDHVRARGCTSTLCVRPEHLEAVTVGENVRRGNGICMQRARRRLEAAA